MAQPLYNLLKKDNPWKWELAEQQAFDGLNKCLTLAPLLLQLDTTKQFYVECNALDYATGAIPSQHNTEGKLAPVACLSKSLSLAEKNYNIFDKEILAVIRAFKEWPGAQNKKANILSRHYNLVPLEGGVENQVLLKPDLFIASITPDQEINDLIGKSIYEDSCLKEILQKLQSKEKILDWELKKGLLWFQEKYLHNTLAAGHPGQARTLELVSRNYYWPSMKEFVNAYVNHCKTCIQSKPTNQVPVGLLKPLQIPEKPWEDIAYNTIVGLPILEGFHAILTVIDQFSKMNLHSLPRSTVLDRGPTFNAKFICHLYKRLDIKPTFSTAYHPQIDGQTERIQREAKIFICMFGNHHQSDWVSLLPLAEFALNNLRQTHTGKSPFQICYGFNPRFSIGQKSEEVVPNADKHAEFLERGYDEVKAALSLSQEKMKYFYDQRHKKEEEIQVGDKVWLSHQNISTDRPSIKLSHKKLGPYLAVEKIGSHVYKLQLPHTMCIHLVFHINLLTKFHPDPPQPAPIITEEGKEEYKVEKILDSKQKGCGKSRKLWYLVKWQGYNEGSNSWEPVNNVANAKEAMEDCYKEHPGAVGA
ncbi:Transposon Ty3-G Gag-Pol polyprotein [Rhizoctonia solani]|uniref:Transposon Ty3-G Gag-Pol polyprotein n=1 Tax=Rhizoctonia solani TaxID=456999 RepID=A0A8H8P739_9AGAM|nr:Transposon Ty3-G Gag-Pol polyprotein [Rhizoctonia solani]QRW26390.1 Transposon Ty3-G Gag-Pol polyprotein [Rhizoctonia solani]